MRSNRTMIAIAGSNLQIHTGQIGPNGEFFDLTMYAGVSDPEPYTFTFQGQFLNMCVYPTTEKYPGFVFSYRIDDDYCVSKYTGLTDEEGEYEAFAEVWCGKDLFDDDQDECFLIEVDDSGKDTVMRIGRHITGQVPEQIKEIVI